MENGSFLEDGDNAQLNGEQLSNGSNLEDNRVNDAQINDEPLTNQSIHRVESIVEDASIFNDNQNEVPENIVQERVELPQGDQERPKPDQGRKAVSCPPQMHGDIVNPKYQSSKKGSDNSTSILSIAGNRFQKSRKKLTESVMALEGNSEIHTDVLNEKIKRISKDFKAINIDNILEKFIYDPNCDEIFEGTAQEISDWYDDLESRIEHLQDLAEGQIAERKSAVSSGFEKRSFPRFDGSKLDYYSFKKQWFKEVSVERQHPDRELASLTASLYKPAQHKIVDCETLKEVWSVLDREYGDLKELRAALKLKISSIKLKSQAGPSKVLELFNEVQYLTVKVRAHGGDNSLRYDEEYV